MKKYRATSQRVVLFLAFVSLIFTGASQGLVNAAGSFLVPPSDDLPALDGVCSPAEYADANPATFTVDAIPWPVTVYVKHTSAFLHVCFDSMPIPASNSFAAVFVDVANDGGTVDGDDFILRMPFSGTRSGNYGSTATGQFTGGSATDWNASVAIGKFDYSAEFRIGRELVGGWQHDVGLSVAHILGTNDTGTNDGWPADNLTFTPESWADAVLFTGETTVPESSTTPVMDGRCGSPSLPTEYADATLVTFDIPIGTATAYLKHTSTDLWVCLQGLQTPDISMRDEPNAVVHINRLGGIGEGRPTAEDMYFGISYNNDPSAARGDGAWYGGPSPGDYTVQRYLADKFFWHAEFRISGTILGGWDREILLSPAQELVTGALDDYAWPAGFNWAIPNTWGVVTLSSSPTGETLDISPAFGGSNLEITQSIQDLDNTVVLIADKRTFVRVYAQQNGTGNVRAAARLYGYRNGISLGPPLMPVNPGGQVNILASPDRTALNDSFNFELPPHWTQAGTITLRAEINPYHTVLESDYANNTISAGPFTFETAKTLYIHLRDVQYTATDGTVVNIDNIDYELLELQLQRMYPIARLYTTHRTIVSRGYMQPQFFSPATHVDPLRDNIGGAAGYVNGMLVRDREAMGAAAHGWLFYGMVDDAMGFMRGKANWTVFNHTSLEAAGPTGYVGPNPGGSPDPILYCGGGGCFSDDDGSYGDWYGSHEIGHSLGRPHADFCGADSWPHAANHPYDNGIIGGPSGNPSRFMGFDTGAPWYGLSAQVLDGASWFDIMSYCPNEWVSDYTYLALREYIQNNDYFPSGMAQPAAPASGDYLTLFGTLNLDTNTADFLHVARTGEVGSIPALDPGTYHIQLFDAADALLADYAFTPAIEFAAELPEEGTFYQVVNFVAGTKRVALYSDDAAQEIGSFTISDNAPAVSNVTHTGGSSLPASGDVTLDWASSDPDGDTLSHSVFYSFDDRANWRLIATGILSDTFTFNTGQLESTSGGSVGWFRVQASDGVQTGYAEDGSFTVAGKAPAVTIIDPVDGATYAYGQNVPLVGVGQDFEDGTLADGALTWTSNLDGILGTGSLLHASFLSVGTHTITLQAVDSDGQTGTATVQVIVTADFSDPGPILSAGPTQITFVTDFGDGDPTPAALHIRNDGTGSLNWTASANAAWLTLGAASGAAPADITFSVDVTGLSVGTHTAQITVQAGGETKMLNVLLIMNGEAIYLPLLTR